MENIFKEIFKKIWNCHFVDTTSNNFDIYQVDSSFKEEIASLNKYFIIVQFVIKT
jgi:hypothetical protein